MSIYQVDAMSFLKDDICLLCANASAGPVPPLLLQKLWGPMSGKHWPSSVAKAFARSALTDFLCPARAHCKAVVSGSWSCLFWWCVQSTEARLWKLWLWSCSSLTFLELSAWWTNLRLCMWNHPSSFKCLMQSVQVLRPYNRLMRTTSLYT